jgi:hypothetical protein
MQNVSFSMANSSREVQYLMKGQGFCVKGLRGGAGWRLTFATG